MKKILGIILTLVVVFVGLTVVLSLVPISSGNPIDGEDASNEYEIISADYSITVSEDHTAKVVEKLSVMFYVKSHGISRYLPTNSGEQYKDIEVDGDVFYVRVASEYIGIYTGSDNYYSYHRGDVSDLTISYTIVPPTRTVSKTNYYMNVVPFGWDTTQSNVTLSVKFPYEIKNIDVYAGRYGTEIPTDSSAYTVSGNELYMEIDKLPSFSGVTIDADFGRKFNVNFSLPGLLAILIILALSALVICIKLFVIKDTRVFPVINSKPPQVDGTELDPAQIGYLIDNNCESKDMAAMIFYFASKGLLKVEIANGGDKFTLTKCGELEAPAPKHQRIIFNGLFKRGNVVTSTQLQNSFYQEMAVATSHLKSDYLGKMYDRKSKTLGVVAAVISAVVAAIFSAAMALRLHFSVVQDSAIMIVLGVMAALTAGGYLVGKYISDNKYKLKQNKLLKTSAIAAIIIMAVSFVVAYLALGGLMPFYARVIMFFGLAVIGFVCGLISRKTPYYTALLNDITGFKNFLESAEKERLEAMLEDNPQYYYDILPYANVLGVSDKWEEKFKGIGSVPPPTYYNGPTVLDFVVFNRIFRTSYKSFSTTMASRPSSSSYSGRGGHGGHHHGGGGFGGGGGGRR